MSRCRTSMSLMNGRRYEAKRFVNTKYDKVVKLFPPKIEYNYKDPKFWSDHQLTDEPYIPISDDEMVELQKVKLEKDYPDRHYTKIDINEEPFRQVLVDTEDNGRFTQTETIADKSIWFWVERLLPKRELPEDEPTDNPEVKASGWRQPKATKPDLDYYIPRTRGKLFPIYRRYEIVDRNYKEFWKNRWDGLFNSYHKELLEDKNFYSTKFENNESTIVLTQIKQIKGDIWKFEEDLRGSLEERFRRRILTAINEPNCVLSLKGDYVNHTFKWLIDRGF